MLRVAMTRARFEPYYLLRHQLPHRTSVDKDSHPTKVATKVARPIPTVMDVERGGRRQRRSRRDAQRPPPQSALATLIVEPVVMGCMPPQGAQNFAAAAETDIQACKKYVHGDAVFLSSGFAN